jgi:hypothetical protein
VGRSQKEIEGFIPSSRAIQRVFGQDKHCMELARGIEPPTVAGSAQKLASPAPAEGASPLARSPRRGHIPFETPRLEVQLYGASERN